MDPHWERRLRVDGVRITPQRRLVVRILCEQERHLSAAEIHLLARKQHTHLSLATVYRTLDWLKASGLVCELRLNGDRRRYEIERGPRHQHMVCLGCGKVIEFLCNDDTDAHRDVAAQHGFQIARTHVKLLGYCADCQTN